MKKTTMICVALLSSAMLLASFASAKPTDKPDTAKNVAAKQCAAEKKANPVAFRALYGKHAMRDCIKAQVPQAASDLKNAAKECKAEQKADPTGFESTYGDPYSNDAFGKCVSTKVQAGSAAAAETFKNAAKECKAERSADPEGFKTTYGSVKSKGHNAFGKCVASKVKEMEGSPTA
jgi:hypothetical protein